jgi:hypothetical protein
LIAKTDILKLADVEVELMTEMSEEELKRLIAGLDDAHVIEDIFRPYDLKSNPSARRGPGPSPWPTGVLKP